MSQLFTWSLGIVSTLIAATVGAVVTFLVTTRVNEASFLRQRRFKLWEHQVARIERAIDLVLTGAQLSSQLSRDRLALKQLENLAALPSETTVAFRYTDHSLGTDSGHNVADGASSDPGSRSRIQVSLRERIAELDARLADTLEELERLAFVVTEEGSKEDIQLEKAVAQIEAKARGEQEFPMDLSGFLEAMVVMRDALPVLRS